MYYYLILALFLIVAVCIAVIAYDMNRFVVVPYEIRSPKIKEKYTFVMLSDLHNKAYGRQNEKLIRAITALAPDSVMTAGDMYTSKKGTGSANALALLGALAERFPVYLANGNHEHKTRMNPVQFEDMYEQYVAELKKKKLSRLINEHVVVPKYNLDICGLEIGQEYFKHFKKQRMPSGYVKKLAGGANQERFQILLAHNPIYFQEYADWGADLVLSGHIHGGIIRLPYFGGVVSPAATLFPKYDGGEFTLGGSTMILGRGLGTHTLPVRMFNPGEIVFVTLRPAREG